MKFDPTVIEEFARRLLAQARSTVISFTVLGALVGGAAGLWNLPPNMARCIVGVLIGGLVGLSVGRQRAFRLRLEAQKALCQVAIERNTRSGSQAVRPVDRTEPATAA